MPNASFQVGGPIFDELSLLILALTLVLMVVLAAAIRWSKPTGDPGGRGESQSGGADGDQSSTGTIALTL